MQYAWLVCMKNIFPSIISLTEGQWHHLPSWNKQYSIQVWNSSQITHNTMPCAVALQNMFPGFYMCKGKIDLLVLKVDHQFRIFYAGPVVIWHINDITRKIQVKFISVLQVVQYWDRLKEDMKPLKRTCVTFNCNR